ncbi:uncharacterized protein LOC134407601 [Elgaria multicarinata webbii]|uniref:uncharacterized protein LOC134407601 n=1 Tax=Elgaria multicarinata webbii TaxID=159646 RepID=UPI002FCCC891
MKPLNLSVFSIIFKGPKSHQYLRGDQAHASNAEEEEDDDDNNQYTYEVLPSEGQSKTVTAPRRQEAAEGLYVDRPALRRFSEPNNLLQRKPRMVLLKHGAHDSHDEQMFSCQAIERALEKAQIKMPVLPPFPLSARRVSLPILAPSGSQAKAATSRDPLPAVKDNKEESHEEEEEEESIYVECDPSATSEPYRELSCPVPMHHACPLKQPKPKLSSPGPQQVLAENLPEGV